MFWWYPIIHCIYRFQKGVRLLDYIPEIFVKAIRALYNELTSQVYIKDRLTEPFKVATGVLRGDVLAPFLFIIVTIFHIYLQKISAI